MTALSADDDFVRWIDADIVHCMVVQPALCATGVWGATHTMISTDESVFGVYGGPHMSRRMKTGDYEDVTPRPVHAHQVADGFWCLKGFAM